MATDAEKIEAIRNVLRTYFEVDPWTEKETGLFNDMFTADEALDEIVRILS